MTLKKEWHIEPHELMCTNPFSAFHHRQVDREKDIIKYSIMYVLC